MNATMVMSPADRSSYIVHQAKPFFNKNFVYELLNRMGGGQDCENVSAKTCAQEMKWVYMEDY